MPSLLKKRIFQAFLKIVSAIEDFMGTGSGWMFSRALALDLECNELPRYSTAARSDLKIGATPQPQKRLNKFVGEVPDEGNFCFLHSIIYLLYSDKIKNPKSLSEYKKFYSIFNLESFTFPLATDEIPRFLNANKKLNLRLNLFYSVNSGDEIIPLEHSLGRGRRVLNILLVEKKDKNGVVYLHSLPILNLNKLLTTVYKKVGKMSFKKSFFCPYCMQEFGSLKVQKEHEPNCINFETRGARAPDPLRGENFIFFKNVGNTIMQHLVAFLDFECVLKATKEMCSKCDKGNL